MPSKDRTDSSADFEEAVQTAHRLIERLLPPGRKKAFPFAPGRDLSPLQILVRKSSREQYNHFRSRLAATLRLQRSLPPNLSKAAAEVLVGNQPRFRKKARKELIIVIGMAVEEASQHLPTFRNEATDRQTSACDAVAEAATRRGHKMTYDSVASRFKQYRKMKDRLPAWWVK